MLYKILEGLMYINVSNINKYDNYESQSWLIPLIALHITP